MPGPIITRTQWGARYANGFIPVPQPAHETWLHHTDTATLSVDASFDEDAAQIRYVEQIGQDRFGGGISYNFLLMPSGRIFQGVTTDRQGAHTLNHNTVGRGIALMGTYMTTVPSQRQQDAVRWLLAEGKRNGWWTSDRLTGGHRDVGTTDCPGDRAYALIPTFNIPWEEPDMDARQAAQLDCALHELAGGPEPWVWGGFDPTYDPPLGQNLSIVDMIRLVLSQHRALTVKVNALASAVDAVGTGEVDYETLAATVATLLATRLVA